MSQRENWTWNKDGEFWFSDLYGQVGGSLADIGWPHTIAVDMISGAKTAERLLVLIRYLMAEFPDHEMHLSLSGETGTLLRDLANDGQIAWEAVDHPCSKVARILRSRPA